ncbi:MAG: hypothetical protein R3C61_27180 [Bacteroidia bacterium]
MKTFRITPSYLMIALIATLTWSCQEETLEIVSEEEAVEVIESAVVTSTEGMSSQVEDAAAMTEVYVNSICGQSFDSTITKSLASGTRTYNYTYMWDGSLTCNGAGIPQSISFTYSSNGQYDTPRMSSADQASGSFVLSGLQPSSGNYVYNGSFGRSGSQTSKIRNQNSFTSQLTLTTTNLTVDKSSYEILSGTADVVLTGTASNGTGFSFTGQITFNGNQSATLIVNGTSYPISW